jgi:hypothetical protein
LLYGVKTTGTSRYEGLTQVAPVAHPGDDDDALPKVARNIEELADGKPEDESESLVHVREQEERPNRGHVRRREGGNDVGEDKAREREVHGDLGRAARGRGREKAAFSEQVSEEDGDITEGRERQWRGSAREKRRKGTHVFNSGMTPLYIKNPTDGILLVQRKFSL